MLNLDVRDLSFWVREAHIKHLRNRMDMAQAARVAMAKNSGYERYMSELSHKLHILEHGMKDVVKESWQALKEMRRG